MNVQGGITFHSAQEPQEKLPEFKTPRQVLTSWLHRVLGKLAVWEDGSMWADVPSPAENGAGGRKRICWLSGTDAFMGAAHLNNKNAPIIILVLFLFN